MKNTNNMMFRKEVFLGLLILICISNISAFAISSDYWSGNALKLYSGESKEFSLLIQNQVSTSDLKLRVTVTAGSELVRLADPSNIYVVPVGEKKNANFVATVPLGAKPGQVYNIRIDFSEVKDSANGEFGIGTAIGQSFNLVVLPETTGWNKTVVLYFAAGITVLLIIIFTLRRVMKGKSHRKRR